MQTLKSYVDVLPKGKTAVAVLTDGTNFKKRGTTAETGIWPMRRERVDYVLVYFKAARNSESEVWIGEFVDKEWKGKYPVGARSTDMYAFKLRNYRQAGTTEASFTKFCGADKSRSRLVYLPRNNPKEKNWLYEAARAWEMLVRLAKARETADYTFVAGKLNTNPLSVRLALEPIQSFCMEQDLPPLTVLVHNRQTGLPSKGFIAWDLNDLPGAYEAVHSYPWGSIVNPFGQIGPGDTLQKLVKSLLTSPEAAKDIYARVKVRGVFQRIFKEALMQSYEGKCAFCGLSLPHALEAAHIVPWSASRNLRADVRNGLLLCSTHHRLFDSGWLSVDSKFQIAYSDKDQTRLGPYGKQDRMATIALHGKRLQLPGDQAYWPASQHLAWHKAHVARK